MEKYWTFARDTLKKNGGEYSSKSFRSRFSHTQRVYKWLEKLIVGLEIDEESLRIATICHDIGRNKDSKENHGKRGAALFREFVKSNNLSINLDYICYLIENHSNKEMLKGDIPLELVLLMEADVLDEEGAMGITFDLLTIGDKKPNSYEEAYVYLKEHSASILLEKNPMVTETGKRLWENKRKITQNFVEELMIDLGM